MARASSRRRVAVASAIAGIASAAALAAMSLNGISLNPDFGRPIARAGGTTGTSAGVVTRRGSALGGALTRSDDRPAQHIVVFRDASLATYAGGVPGIAKPARKGGGTGRIDVAATSSLAYVDYLEEKQRGYVDRINQALGRQLKVERRMQHALNAVVTTISPLEAEAIAQLPEVLFVQARKDVPQDTDVGPTLIGASNVWAGIAGSFGDGPSDARGEGVLVGIIDSGVNFGSPSFAAVDPIDGYVHVNPNGSGNFLGTCGIGQVDEGRCNDKLIGGYDFVCASPGNACSDPTNIREEPGFGDTNGHGSHTASTAAGNHREEFFNGAAVAISGVAPRANVIAYDVCYTRLSDERGLCPNLSSAAAVDQAIADGVDVINFSIGGGTQPWNDAVSLAFLNATNAGVFVATSAGNSGPGAATLGHVEPWTTSSAAAQHGRAAYGFAFSVTAPTTPANLQDIPLTPGTGGVSQNGPLTGASVTVSPGIGTADDGCAAYAENLFLGAVAVIRRGGCSFSIKVNSATDAGAIAVIIANNAAGALTPSVPGTTIPAFAMSQADGDALATYAVSNPGIGADLEPVVIPNTVDALASFSSRGPSGFKLLKPDITSPGVSVLAAYAGTTLTGSEGLIATISGTSMASPHTAGAAALMRQLHPSWTVPEIKSALQMTANESVLLEDQTTPANPHAGGAGRTQVDRAARAGLVLNETFARFTAANPATGGQPDTLNLASMESTNCTSSCTFVRTVRNTTGHRQTWSVQLEGLAGTVSPAKLDMKIGQSRKVTITIDGSALPTDGSYTYGVVRFTAIGSLFGSDTSLPQLHMPVAVRHPLPPPPSTVLANGVPTNVAGAQNSQTYYSFTIPSGVSSLSVVMAGGTGDADLFVKHGEAPVGAAADCVSAATSNNESCNLANPQAGTWYVRVDGFSAYAGATLTATW